MSKSQFRILVLGVFLLNFVNVALSIIFENPQLREIEAFAKNVVIDHRGFWLLLISIIYISILMVVYSVSMIGLMFYQKWAKKLFALTFIFVIPIYVKDGIQISDVLQRFISDMLAWGHGAILALMYFSPVKDLFQKRS
jgi:hypothetical protein